jgi:hypothetical protein
MSGGDNMRANGGGSNAKASIEGGLIIALVALVFSILAIGVSWYLAASSATAVVRAEIAERRANIAEINAKQIYVELNRLGYPVLTPAEPHPMQPSEEAP